MSSRPAAPEDPRAGFTLIEVLVASAVAVVMLVALLRAFSGIWDLGTRVREEAEGMIVARAVLEAAGTREALSVRAQEGRAGAYRWAVAIEQLPIAAPPPLPEVVAARRRLTATASADEDEDGDEEGGDDAANWQLYRIRVAVVAPSGRRTLLESLKLGPAPR
jgi:prepilin-type N-terminal cleavage/methylation domain-containing protein